MAPAHPYLTGVAMYPAFFSMKITPVLKLLSPEKFEHWRKQSIKYKILSQLIRFFLKIIIYLYKGSFLT